MVSKASDDLPEPLIPVITRNLSLGRVSSIFFRLCYLEHFIFILPFLAVVVFISLKLLLKIVSDP